MLYSNFVVQVFEKQSNVSVKLLLKLYKIAHVYKIEEYKRNLLEIICRKTLNDNDILHILETIESIDEKNPLLIQKIIDTCTSSIDTLYPKIKVMVTHTLLRLSYTPGPEVEEFVLKMLIST